ncbi:MAG: NAD(P)/FAD-dependent oxidoreductase [Tepidisphaeraceae bacterium]
MPPPDVIIIGAGPAGCVAACLLARASWRVTLVEQHRFPRDKVCGECLSAVGIDVLHRAGLLEFVEPIEPVRLTHALLHAPDGASVTITLTREMWGLSRLALDRALLDAARSAGAAVLQPARCERLDVASKSVTIRDLDTNRISTLPARLILLADGKAGLMSTRPPPTTDLGVKAHFTGVDGPADAIELFGVAGHYGGLAPIEGGRWNAAFSVPMRRVRDFGGDLDALFAQIVGQNVALARRLRRATRVTAWLSSPLPRFPVAGDWPAHVIPLGNAAAALEPIGGQGMGLAMRSAEMVAMTLIEAGGAGIDRRALRRRFKRLWALRRTLCRATAVAMSSPRLASFTIDAARIDARVARQVMAWIGKD